MQWSNAYNCVAFPYRNIIKTELEAVANPHNNKLFRPVHNIELCFSVGL